jgi:methyl-accepting chemotaxis protein
MRLRVWQKIAAVVALGAALFFAYVFEESPRGAMATVIGWGLVTAFIYFQLNGLEEILERARDLKHGRVPDRPLPERADEVGDIARALNAHSDNLRATRDRIAELASGKIGAADAESSVRKSGGLAAADVESSGSGELNRAIDKLASHMRKLSVQARVISRDEIDSALLDERLPGELGRALSHLGRHLREFQKRATAISKGDLTQRLAGGGELTTTFNSLVDAVTALIDEITHTSLHISSSSEEILAVLRDQELSASHQASGVEETQRTMETLLSSAKKIAESAQTVFKSAEKTQANNRIVAQRIGELKSHTERIGEILNVIKSIADRSDLLALNASLEGMRAGEAGKGFTLVAAEMRRLAENIKGSVGDIEEMLSDIRESALSSVMATEEGTSLSEKTTDSALKITLITQQQQSGTEQVTQSMEELSTLINQGVAGTQQVTIAASELVRMSGELREHVEGYRVGTRRRAPSRTASTTAHGLPSRNNKSAPRVKPVGRRDDYRTPVNTGESSQEVARGESPTMQLTGLDDDIEKAVLAEFASGDRARSIEDQIDALEAEIDATNHNSRRLASDGEETSPVDDSDDADQANEGNEANEAAGKSSDDSSSDDSDDSKSKHDRD